MCQHRTTKLTAHCSLPVDHVFVQYCVLWALSFGRVWTCRIVLLKCLQLDILRRWSDVCGRVC